jgi:hypothetical protein
MKQRDAQLFSQVFGVHSEELLAVLTKKGDYIIAEEEIFDKNGASLGKKRVRRKPSVHPVANHEVWHQYWTEKFIKSGQNEVFQTCQLEVAAKNYMDIFLAEIVGKSISEKSLALIYDRSVNQGPGQGITLAQKAVQANEKQFWDQYIPTRSDNPDIHRRLTHIYNSPHFLWETIYEIKS